MFLSGFSGMNGNELLFFVLPLLLAVGYLAWLLISAVKAFISSVTRSQASAGVWQRLLLALTKPAY
jgi:hypothetical protein